MSLRILMVASGMPDPPRSGAAIRISQFAHQLARRHQLTLLCFGGATDFETADHMRATGIRVVLVPVPRRSRKRAGQMVSLMSSRSHLGGIFHHQALQHALDDLVRVGRFDAILVEGSLLMRHRFPHGIPLVLDEHNLEFEALERTASIEASPLRRFFNSVEAEKFKREEMTAWRRADLCLFTSGREVALARDMFPQIAAFAVANGVDLDYFRPQNSEKDPASIVFTGTIGYRPNSDAVQYLVREIMPRIWEAHPEAVLTVVGGGVPRAIRRLAGPHVVVTGQVADVRPFVHRAAVAVAPLRIGSGTRLKVLEALAMGKPMVASTLGCEGLAVRAGEHLAIADEPEGFARELVSLLEDRTAAEAMGARGRALVERSYGWRALTLEMEYAVESAVAVHEAAERRLSGQTPTSLEDLSTAVSTQADSRTPAAGPML
ncbi:MAG TPA: glycosyltransferase family 4 protein [Candidatus Dormibacteraeota bacterium]|nr:glycosyltransferase family 4 protein [Candidatus Dormibacteraeota bacterium]